MWAHPGGNSYVRTVRVRTYVSPITDSGHGSLRMYVRTHVRMYFPLGSTGSICWGLNPRGANILAQIRDMGVHVSVKANMICKPQRLRLAGTTNSGPGTAPVNHVTCVLIKRCLGQALRMPSVRLSALSTDRMQPRDCYGPRSPSPVGRGGGQMDLPFLDNAGRWLGRTNSP